MRYHISRDSNGPLSKFPYGLVASVLHLLQIRSLHLLEKYLVMVVLLAYAGPMMRHRVTVMHGRREERRRCHLPNRIGLGCVLQFIVGPRLKACRDQWPRNDAGKYIKNVVSPESKALPVPSPRISYQCTSGSMHTKRKLVLYFPISEWD